MAVTIRHMNNKTPLQSWIAEQLRELQHDQRQLAIALGWDPSALNRALHGGRALQHMEADTIVAVLAAMGAPLPPGWTRQGDWTDEQLFYATALRRELRQRALSAEDAARITGESSRLIMDLTKQRGQFEDAPARRIAAELGLDLDAMRQPPLLPQAAGPAVGSGRPGSPKGRQERDMPIHAPPRVDSVGRMRWDSRVAEYWPTPPQLASVAGAFGFFAPAGWLEPRYLGGEVIFIHPMRPVASGGYALIEFSDGTMAVERVLTISTTELEVEVAPGDRPRRYQKVSIVRLRRVVGSWSE
jgi:hypothetical protein